MKSCDHPLNDVDHNSDDASRNTQSAHDEVHRQNLYMHWAHQRWARAQHDAAMQCRRSHKLLRDAQRRAGL